MPAGQRATAQTVSRPRAAGAWLGGISLAVLAADQLAKALVAARFQPGDSVPLLPLLRLTYVQNTGAAFGLFKGGQLVFILVSLGVIGWILRETVRAGGQAGRAWLAAAGLVLGGAAGNLLDRVRLGHVIDFIDLRVWPVFNVGDAAITVGVALLILQSLRAGRRS